MKTQKTQKTSTTTAHAPIVTPTNVKPQPLPHRIMCVITGQYKSVRPDVLKQRIQKAGSLEALKVSYFSSEARRLLREGKTVAEIRAIISKNNPKDPVPTNSIPEALITGYTSKVHHLEAGDRKFTVTKENVDDNVEQFLGIVTEKMRTTLQPTVKRFVRQLQHAS